MNNLRICFIRNKKGSTWETRNNVGLHSNFLLLMMFVPMSGLKTSSKSLGGIICVVASFQYSPIHPPSEFDLAEWGVVIFGIQRGSIHILMVVIVMQKK